VIGWVEIPWSARLSRNPDLTHLVVDLALLPSSSRTGTVHVAVVDAHGRPSSRPADSVYLEDDHSNPVSAMSTHEDTLSTNGEIVWRRVPFGNWIAMCRSGIGNDAVVSSTTRLDAQHDRVDIELRLPSTDVRPTDGRLRLTLLGADAKPIEWDRTSSKRSSAIGRGLRLYQRIDGELRPASLTESDEASEPGDPLPLLVARGMYVLVAEPHGGPAGIDLAAGSCEVDVTSGRADLTITLKRGVSVTIRAAPAVPIPSEGIGFQIRVVDESGIPVTDWTHPSNGSGTGATEATTILAPGRYRATVFYPEHDAATATIDVPGDTTVTIPMKLSSR
jgi:hypothetical protein